MFVLIALKVIKWLDWEIEKKKKNHEYSIDVWFEDKKS